MKTENRSHCPITFALDLFGDKWSLLILRDILFKNKKYYQEFSKSEEGIATNILADRLLKLENNGFITKTKDETNKKQNIYSPTKKSQDLIPMLVEMIAWSAQYDPKTGVPPKIKKQLIHDKNGYIKQVMAKTAGS